MYLIMAYLVYIFDITSNKNNQVINCKLLSELEVAVMYIYDPRYVPLLTRNSIYNIHVYRPTCRQPRGVMYIYDSKPLLHGRELVGHFQVFLTPRINNIHSKQVTRKLTAGNFEGYFPCGSVFTM